MSLGKTAERLFEIPFYIQGDLRQWIITVNKERSGIWSHRYLCSSDNAGVPTPDGGDWAFPRKLYRFGDSPTPQEVENHHNDHCKAPRHYITSVSVRIFPIEMSADLPGLNLP